MSDREARKEQMNEILADRDGSLKERLRVEIENAPRFTAPTVAMDRYAALLRKVEEHSQTYDQVPDADWPNFLRSYFADSAKFMAAAYLLEEDQVPS